MFQLNGNPISIDSEQVINGIRYPHLRDPALREQLGVVEVADPEQYDQRFYWGVDNPKDLDGLKTLCISQFKDTAGQLLAQTDWMIVRKMERSIDVPDETATYRASVVSECARLETAITSATDVAALIAAINSQNWGE